MKNIFKTALASLLLMASCATDEDFVIPTSTPDTFYASIEAPETRTYADEDGKLLWTANDQITIFKGNTTPLTFQFTGETGQNYGGFNNITPESGDEFVTSNPLNANYAIYPSVANTTISNAGVINFTIPATQNYAENSFGLGANVMVAVTEDKSDNNLSFKNLGGYFEFSLYGDVTVKSIEFKGNNGEDLAGAAAITATYNGTPTFEFTGETSKTLTLDCGTGVELGTEANPTKFWFVVPAITYSNGITITITDTEDGVMEKSTSKSITIERSTLQPLNAFLVETIAPIPETWKIYYTATSKVTPYKTDVFGANIVSNEWNETTGEGVISFDGEVTSIGEWAFYRCNTLTSITIPESITSIEDAAFDGCSNLSTIILPEGITQIPNWLFRDCTNLTNVTLPQNLTRIGSWAFENCVSLTNISIPDNVTEIRSYAFNGCINLENISLPQELIEISSNTFANCTKLKSISMGEKISNIGIEAFYNCSNLENIAIPNSVQYIWSAAFKNCASLTSITLPNSGFKKIDSKAFQNCTKLANVQFGSVQEIGEYAFANCSNLTEVWLPACISTIWNYAFADCTNLESVYCRSIYAPHIEDATFENNAPNRKIYVPMSYINNYKNSVYWSDYISVIEGYNF